MTPEDAHKIVVTQAQKIAEQLRQSVKDVPESQQFLIASRIVNIVFARYYTLVFKAANQEDERRERLSPSQEL